ncbi:hypothetical protein HDU91_007409 [Kappamyces sp. JEL0680]|nr:hypothetical protein HDU91_007409 [Kappamyces sp. JEL0680]
MLRAKAAENSVDGIVAKKLSAAKKGSMPVSGKLANAEAARKWTPPPFTLKQVRDCIPKHCWERNTLVSLSYVALDLSMITALCVFASQIHVLPQLAQPLAWVFYWVMQGIVGVGIWILAHECGHGAFSDYTLLNHCVGWVLHSMVLIPFFSWKYSHAKHHKATGHYAKDMVFVPTSRRETIGRFGSVVSSAPAHRLDEGDQHVDQTPIESFLFIMGILVFGFPLYLLKNLGGQDYGGKWVSHYFPNAPIFEPHQARGVVISNIGLLLWIGIQVGLGIQFGWMTPVAYFVIPWIQVNMWYGTGGD